MFPRRILAFFRKRECFMVDNRQQNINPSEMRSLQLILFFFVFSVVQSQDIANLVHAYAASYVNTGDFSGCILISERGDIVYEDCFGYANYSFKLPNDKQTKFKIGSISKQFTAVAILMLEQEGKLNTTDTLLKYFPNNPNAKKITIHQLLTHTSGITDIYNVPEFNKLSCQKLSISDLSSLLLETGLVFEPGSAYQYSNGGYAILADIIQQVSNTSYQQFLRNVIFDPLGMKNTGHNNGNEVVIDLSTGYDPAGYDDVKITDYIDPELLKGSGSLYSNIHDLQIWINSIKNKTLLSSGSYRKLLNNYGSNYGYGISLYKSFDKKVFGHDGRINGYIADYLHYEEPDISVIILGNVQTGVADFFRRDIAAIVFGEQYESRAKSIDPGNSALSNHEKLIGIYAFGPNFKVYINQFDGILQARANEGGSSELVLLNDGRYFNRTLYSYIDFVENEDGEVTKMIWTNNDGNSFEGIKE